MDCFYDTGVKQTNHPEDQTENMQSNSETDLYQ